MKDQYLLVNDQQAYEALLSSQEKALEYFFNLYYTSILYYARSITRNEPVSEDIAMESFSKLWKNRSSLKQPSQVKHFLYRVAHNSSIDFLRFQANSRKLRIDQAFCCPPSDSHLETIITTETYNSLYRLVSSLAPKARQVFLMFYFDNKSTKQIARELSISVNTVNEHKKRAMRFLRNNLAALNTFLLILSFFW